MNIIKSAVILAFIAESILCLGPALFGFYFLWPGNGGIVVEVSSYFHLPGILLADRLFSDSNYNELVCLSDHYLVFVVFTGLIQSFLFAWLGITVWKRVHEQKAD